MLALVTDAYGGRGGIAQYNRDFLTAVAAAGTAVTVLLRYAPDAVSTPRGVGQRRPRGGRVAYALEAVRLALTKRVDIVFCGHLYLAPLALLIARLKGAKLILQMHGIEAWPKPSFARRVSVEAADCVLCVSRYTRAQVLDWAAIAPERVMVHPNTVGEDCTPGDGSALRRTWKLEGKQVLLTVGRLDSRERYKGHDKVIAALPKLVEQGHDVVYLIVGAGDDDSRLKALSAEHGVADHIRFLGALSRQEVIDAYCIADLFVMPSTGEGFGIAFLEAMACGTPALGLGADGSIDALCDGELGTAASESELDANLATLLARCKPDPYALSDEVRSRFGQIVFSERVSRVVTSVLGA